MSERRLYDVSFCTRGGFNVQMVFSAENAEEAQQKLKELTEELDGNVVRLKEHTSAIPESKRSRL